MSLQYRAEHHFDFWSHDASKGQRERRELEDYYWTLTFGFAPHTSLSYDFMEYSKVAMNYFIGAFFVILKHEHNSCTQECTLNTAHN